MSTKFLGGVFIIVVASLLNAACKKIDFVPKIAYTTLRVLEFKTDLPVADAKVKIYECKKYSFGSCSDVSLLRTLTTDKDGNFQFDSKLRVFEADASHDQYWDGGSGAQPITDIHLIPIAQTKIHLQKINTHSQDALLHIFFCGLHYSYNQVEDSTVIIESYGNSDNSIDWYFTDDRGNKITTETSGQVPIYYINRFDTASVEINY
jgi:hypothetical protein